MSISTFVFEDRPLHIEIEDSHPHFANIRVFGVGGGGSNALARMIETRVPGVNFTFANTDLQALSRCPSAQKLQLGQSVTHGRGAGADPELARASALEDTSKIMAALTGLDMVFIAAGLGGGTGTGAAPVIAALAREMGVLSVAIVTLPFEFEGKQRLRRAEVGLDELYACADAVVVIRNERLLQAHGPNLKLTQAFRLVDDLMGDAVRGVTDLVSESGLINLDFADVRTTMSNMGSAIMGTGRASGDDRAVRAAELATSSPLLDNNSIAGARNVIVRIAGGTDLTLYEVNEAASVIHDLVDSDASIIFGSVQDPALDGSICVTVIANGQPHIALPASVPHIPQISPAPHVTFDERMTNQPAYLRRRALG